MAERSTFATKYGDAVFFEKAFFQYDSKNLGGGIRREVSSFSWKSSKRFCDFLCKMDFKATIERFGEAKWITLTFDGSETGADEAKKHFDYVLSKRFPRFGIDSPIIWKAELQKRGTIHFHLLAFTPILAECLKCNLNQWWHEVTGSTQPAHLVHGVDVKRVSSLLVLKCYLAKYLTKNEGEWKHGRVWGVRKRKNVIMLEGKRVELEIDLERLLETFKKCKIQVPRTIYNFPEFVEYGTEMFTLSQVDRISYYKWRKLKKAERKRQASHEVQDENGFSPGAGLSS